MSAITLFDSGLIKSAVKTQFKKIKKSETTVDNILDQLITRLNSKFTVVKSAFEISIKVDKRKNIETVREEVQGILDEIQVSFDMKYLFKIKVGQNEIVVRARRK